MLAVRLAYTVAMMAVVVWLLRSGHPLGGLLVVPLLAVWLRRKAESGELLRAASRVARTR